MRVSKGLKQAYDVQDIAFGALVAYNEGLRQVDANGHPTVKLTKDDAQAIGALVRAWEAGQERVRIHRGRPLPGSMRPRGQAEATSGVGLGG